MCGIAGFSSPGTLTSAETMLKAMTDALVHRGPDAEGHWHDGAGLVSLGHRRLSIQDLSSAGAQPMHSSNARFTVTYNGEIYNNSFIRNQLLDDGHRISWRGSSDTETLLECLSIYGVEATIDLLNGMFAICIYDHEEQTITLVRDRLGEKPLYYYCDDNNFVFASELKSLVKHSGVETKIDRNALDCYFQQTSIPAPLTIYSNVRKLLPGQLLQWNAKDKSITKNKLYWDLKKVANDGQSNLLTADSHEIVDMLEVKLSEAIEMRKVSDVPLGAFLSGGVDSSLIVALMAQNNSSPVKTFTVGFSDAEYDESTYAAAVAKHLNTEHTEMYVTEQDALNIIPDLPKIWDEPFADPSQIPTYLIAKLTRKHVTVCISGDGGDESFYGYSRYQDAIRLWSVIQSKPLVMRQVAHFISSRFSVPFMNVMDAFTGGKPKVLYKILVRSSSLSGSFKQTSFDSFYLWMKRTVRQQIIVSGAKYEFHHNDENTLWSSDPKNGMMLDDMSGYLPNTVLTKVDRGSMAASLESRAPFLDHKLVEFAWRIPTHIKYSGNQTKWPLKQILQKHVPSALFDRPKQGFGVPVGSWLNGSLREWAESLLDQRKIEEQGLLDGKVVARMWMQHKQGVCNWQYQLWTILMFQAWLEGQQE